MVVQNLNTETYMALNKPLHKKIKLVDSSLLHGDRIEEHRRSYSTTSRGKSYCQVQQKVKVKAASNMVPNDTLGY